MNLYEHSYSCPKCDKKWKELKLRPPKQFINSRTCKDCFTKKSKERTQQGTVDRRCKNCVHFVEGENTNRFWKMCALGVVGDSDEDEPLGLVSEDHSCKNFKGEKG